MNEWKKRNECCPLFLLNMIQKKTWGKQGEFWHQFQSQLWWQKKTYFRNIVVQKESSKQNKNKSLFVIGKKEWIFNAWIKKNLANHKIVFWVFTLDIHKWRARYVYTLLLLKQYHNYNKKLDILILNIPTLKIWPFSQNNLQVKWLTLVPHWAIKHCIFFLSSILTLQKIRRSN